MIRTLLCLLLGGCMQVVPAVDPHTDAISCCLAVAELSRTTDATLQITKPAANLQVKLGFRSKF
jgi:hypothetical protein